MPLNTLSRLKGIETRNASCACESRRSTLNTLSRLKGIETISSVTPFKCIKSLNTLSRLKGIETFQPCNSSQISIHSEYTFPFEGN